MGGGAPTTQPDPKTKTPASSTTFQLQGQKHIAHPSRSHPQHSTAAASLPAAAPKRRASRRRAAATCRTTTIYADLASEHESSTSPSYSSSCSPHSSSSSFFPPSRRPATALSPPRPPPPLAVAADDSSSASSISPPSPSLDPYSSPVCPPPPSTTMDPVVPNGLPPHALPYAPSAAPPPASYPSSYTKFNTALNAGLLNPMSPPPPPPSAIRSSPTLFEMMANEQDAASAHYVTNPSNRAGGQHHNQHYPAGGGGRQPQHGGGSGLSLQERQLLLQERVAEIVGSSCNYCCCCGGATSPPRMTTMNGTLGANIGTALLHLNDPDTCDVRLTLTSRDHDALSATVDAHRAVLAASSRFFASRLVPLSDHARAGPRHASAHPTLVDISDCDDVEAYAETLRLMYCGDPRRRLMRDVVDVPRVLAVLRVSAALGFDKGVAACLECLEAAPWGEDEEDKVAGVLGQLRLDADGSAVGEVLKRLVMVPAATMPPLEPGMMTPPPLPCSSSSSPPPAATAENDTGVYDHGQLHHYQTAAATSEEILLRLLQVVLEGKDEKARREMKALVSKMLRENHAQQSSSATATAAKHHPGTTAPAPTTTDISRDSLYSACDACLGHLRRHFSLAASGDLSEVSQIARQADNLHWLLDILVDRRAADGFLRAWSAEADLAAAHPRVPAVHRHEVSRVTARLLVGVGKGQILVPKESRCLLLSTWLEPLYEDFGWMRRVCKGGMDRHSVEDGLSNTVLTLPMAMQQDIFLAWFDRFLNSGDDCPNIQRGFEVWWRRAFWRRHGEPERPKLHHQSLQQHHEQHQMLRVTAASNLDENPSTVDRLPPV